MCCIIRFNDVNTIDVKKRVCDIKTRQHIEMKSDRLTKMKRFGGNDARKMTDGFF